MSGTLFCWRQAVAPLGMKAMCTVELAVIRGQRDNRVGGEPEGFELIEQGHDVSSASRRQLR